MTPQWSRQWSALRRYKWMILAVTGLAAAVGAFAARRAQPMYMVQGTLWIEVGGQGARGPIQDGQLLETFGWVELLKSYIVLDEVVRDLRLYLNPASGPPGFALETFSLAEESRPGAYRLVVGPDGGTYDLQDGEGVTLETGRVGGPIGTDLGFRWVPPVGSLQPAQILEFSVSSPRDTARRLGENLFVRIDQAGNFIRMELLGTGPERLAATVNAIAERYVEVAADLKGAKTSELLGILKEQVEEARVNMETAEIALEDFRIRTITLPSELSTPAAGLAVTRDPVFERFFDRQIELDGLRQDRQAIERVLEQAKDSVLSVELLETIAAVPLASQLSSTIGILVQRRADLRTLRFRYTDTNPQVQRAITEIATLEKETIPSQGRALIDALAAREADLEAQIATASTDLQNIPPRVMEEARLQRKVEIAAGLYQSLEQRYAEARLSQASNIPDVRILDRAAVPRAPETNPGIRLFLMAVVGGFGCAVMAAMVLERIDPKLRYPEQVTEELMLPVLGAIPHVRNGGRILRRENLHAVVEAFRAVRLNLVFAHPTRPVVVAVTSPEGGAGKSFISSNLALAFADRRQRTLIIDADTRRGVQHRLMHRDRKPGLIDYLEGSAELEDVIRPTDDDFLDLISSGTRRGVGPGLLESERMQKLIENMRLCYEAIIIDTPPLQAGTDANVLANLTQNIVLVLRTGVTNRLLAGAQLRELDLSEVNILGVVLNDAPQDGAYAYYAYPRDYAALEEDGSEPEYRLLKA